MKYTLLTTAALLAMGIAPALAEDGHVSHQTLSAIGLGGMQVVSDTDGMQVRGMSSSAWSSGRSLLSAQLIDPATNSFVVGSDTNGAFSTAENAGLNSVSSASHSQASNLALNLAVATLGSAFNAATLNGAFGNGISSAF
jgi:hypothetical protein